MAIAASVTRGSNGLLLKPVNGRRPRLLFAEDSDPARVLTSAMLKSMGCDVDAVPHGEDAVTSATARNYDVIVLDIEMPVMDGITAAHAIRDLGGKAASTPIMAMSAFLADAMQCSSWNDAFDIALPKPANKNELHTAVRAALDWQPHIAPGATGENLPLVCATLLADLGQGLPPALVKELLGVACRDIGHCVDELENLQRTTIRGADAVYVQKLMGLGRTFAAPRLSRSAEMAYRNASPQGRRQQIERLIDTARATIAALSAA